MESLIKVQKEVYNATSAKYLGVLEEINSLKRKMELCATQEIAEHEYELELHRKRESLIRLEERIICEYGFINILEIVKHFIQI